MLHTYINEMHFTRCNFFHITFNVQKDFKKSNSFGIILIPLLIDFFLFFKIAQHICSRLHTVVSFPAFHSHFCSFINLLTWFYRQVCLVYYNTH